MHEQRESGHGETEQRKTLKKLANEVTEIIRKKDPEAFKAWVAAFDLAQSGADLANDVSGIINERDIENLFDNTLPGQLASITLHLSSGYRARVSRASDDHFQVELYKNADSPDAEIL